MIAQYRIAKDKELTVELLGTILQNYQTSVLPILQKRYNYYTGKHEILNRVPSDEGKPCNKIVCNFVKNIVDTYEGYAVGVPVTYDGENIDPLLEILKENDYQDADGDLFRQGLIFGRAPEIVYFNEDGKPCFKGLDPREVIPVYDDTLDGKLLYAIRFYVSDLVENIMPNYVVEVYDANKVRIYASSAGFASFSFVEERQHNFKRVPVSFFNLNDELEGIADTIFSLQDAYNALLSDSLDDWDSFCDAYLMLKGVVAEGDDLKAMKKNRVLMIDQDADAQYLVKNTQTTEIEHLLETTETKIREMAACPNFASEVFGTSSGIAIKYRLMGMSNQVKAIESNFEKALRERIEILADVSELLEGQRGIDPGEIDITFTDNIPVNITDTATEVNSLRGLVSDRTLLAQIPFVTDVDKELEELQKEKLENIELYNFSNEAEEEKEIDNELLAE